MIPDGPILVLGIGNILLRDEGAGVHVVRALERLADRGEIEMPAGTSLVDGGTLGLNLLPLISSSRAVLLVDALDGDRTSGAVSAISGNALREAKAGEMPGHRTGVGELLAAAQLMGALPEAVSLVGIQPSEISMGLDLTEVVRAALPAAIAMTLDELRRLNTIAPSSARCPAVHADAMKGSMT